MNDSDRIVRAIQTAHGSPQNKLVVSLLEERLKAHMNALATTEPDITVRQIQGMVQEIKKLISIFSSPPVTISKEKTDG